MAAHQQKIEYTLQNGNASGKLVLFGDKWKRIKQNCVLFGDNGHASAKNSRCIGQNCVLFRDKWKHIGRKMYRTSREWQRIGRNGITSVGMVTHRARMEMH